MLSKRITKEYILSKVNDFTIFNHYFGEFEPYNKTYSSPFREDKHPSTGFYIGKKGLLIFNDMATGEKLDCFGFVLKKLQMDNPDTSFHQALEKVANDFGIKDGGEPIIPVKKPEFKEKKEVFIQIKADNWNDHNLAFWKDYNITKEELIENNVYPVKDLYVNGHFMSNDNNFPRYGYLLKDGDKQYLKIYSPYEEDLKWISTIPNNKPFGFNELPKKSNILIITKSQKDRIIWKKYFTDVIAVQFENKGALTEDDIWWIQDNYRKVYVNFDSDKTGKEACKYFNQYGFKWINVPNKFYQEEHIKDFSDMVKAKGLDMFVKYLKYKKLLK